MDSRLHQHVEKGNEDGLHISCVASMEDLLTVVMDAGTNFSARVYKLSNAFLHKVSWVFFHSHIQTHFVYGKVNDKTDVYAFVRENNWNEVNQYNKSQESRKPNYVGMFWF